MILKQLFDTYGYAFIYSHENKYWYLPDYIEGGRMYSYSIDANGNKLGSTLYNTDLSLDIPFFQTLKPRNVELLKLIKGA